MGIIKSNLNDNKSQDTLECLLSSLPELPNTVRYYDDFDGQLRSINNFGDVRVLELHIRGTKQNIYFDKCENGLDVVAKHLFLYLITEDLSASTAYSRLTPFYEISRQTFISILDTKPLDFIKLWVRLLSENPLGYLLTIKSILFFLAKSNRFGWSQHYYNFISKLSLPFQDKFAAVRRGDVFLDTQEEAKIVEYLDELVLDLTNTNIKVDTKSMRNAGILLCSYQFGMRPIQIASLRMKDVRVWNNLEDKATYVHLSFNTTKQRSKTSSHVMLRKVKKEWSPIIIKLYAKNLEEGMFGKDRLFRLDSTQAVSVEITNSVSKIIGRNTSATELRHTGAQRMVDGGASQEELAEFMGHSDITTGLVYFQTSANQAERVNQALGISSIYQQVVKIAHDKFISKQELAELKGAYQIAAVPHGIPIAGIGACTSGQPACPFNPVTSCYGCRKFMPLQDAAIHEVVLSDIRGIVGFFDSESRGDLTSPTYLQLQNTIFGVQQIIAEIKGGNHA